MIAPPYEDDQLKLAACMQFLYEIYNAKKIQRAIRKWLLKKNDFVIV